MISASMDSRADAIYARMHRAVAAGRGVRLSAEELQLLSCTTIGQWMSDASDAVDARKSNPRAASPSLTSKEG